jgi:cell cycle checkpoint protein
MSDMTSFSDPHVLGVTGLCAISYPSLNSPLFITLTEPNITTTCELVTYETSFTDDIPFARDELRLKVIMRAAWLYDAIQELASTSPETLTITASSTAPFFSLEASGPLGSAVVAFQSKDKVVLETFQVIGEPDEAGANARKNAPVVITQSYKFSLIRAAQRAMAVASKVSVRGDDQGVLSLQFMIEVEPGKVSFVDFRFVPLAENDGQPGDESEEETEGENGDADD